MPGQVTEKHAATEKACGKCHEPFEKASQDRLCLACHTDVAGDLDSSRGFHGHEPTVKAQQCKSCHAEHKGRDATLIHLERRTFDHRLTDMPLVGGHTKLDCEGCHPADTRFRDAPSACSDCHNQTKDPHDGTLGMACTSCHDESGWKPAQFDHSATRFPLRDRHQTLRCESCHTSRRFKPTPTECVACHSKNDRHQGTFGSNCLACHTTRGWTGAIFDHARKTSFPLIGRHAATACVSCHKPGTAADHTSATCVSCHARDDRHQGHFGNTCESCHTPIDWRRPTFDHDRHTHFALRGRHKETPCTNCHRAEPRAERQSTTCYSCHRDDDVHNHQQGTRCESCHDERGWSRQVLFDHDASPFPLTGAHTRLICSQCHRSRSYSEVGRQCVSCHSNTTASCAKQGTQCATCHDTATFRSKQVAH